VLGTQRIRRIVENLLKHPASYRASDEEVEAFESVAQHPFLVSFPRTGSHWLRMLMELYFERPTLVRAFYYPESRDYLLLHTHDMDLQVQRSNVLYLYRNPVDTVFSQMSYEKEDLDSPDRIAFWSGAYSRHLLKWLIEDDFTTRKTILSYEKMRRDLNSEFAKVTGHFSAFLDPERLAAAESRVSRNEVKSKTTHDDRVVQLKSDYEEKRERFRRDHSTDVWKTVLSTHARMADFFPDHTAETLS